MKGVGAMRTLTGLAVGLLLTGCVSQQQYDKLKLANRNCNAERERLAQELTAERARSEALQGQLTGMKESLAAKDQMIRNLQGESEAARSTIQKMTEVYESLASTRPPTGEILVTPLPPELDTALKDFAAKHPGVVQYDSARGVIKFVSDVLFDLGSAEVKPGALESLKQFADIVSSPAAEDFDVVVTGHTDNVRIAKPETRAKHPTNWHLSVHRAISVMRVLEGNGVPPEKMGVMGYGEYRPLVPNDSAANRAKNRRVEIYLVAHKR